MFLIQVKNMGEVSKGSGYITTAQENTTFDEVTGLKTIISPLV
jgi:hypothetical protein